MLNIYSEISQKNKLKGKSLVDLGGLSVSATSSENLDRYWIAVKQIALSNRTEINFLNQKRISTQSIWVSFITLCLVWFWKVTQLKFRLTLLAF